MRFARGLAGVGIMVVTPVASMGVMMFLHYGSEGLIDFLAFAAETLAFLACCAIGILVGLCFLLPTTATPDKPGEGTNPKEP